MIYNNLKKLKTYDNDRQIPVFITEQLSKLFYKQKQLLMSQFQAAKRDDKKYKLGSL